MGALSVKQPAGAFALELDFYLSYPHIANFVMTPRTCDSIIITREMHTWRVHFSKNLTFELYEPALYLHAHWEGDGFTPIIIIMKETAQPM